MATTPVAPSGPCANQSGATTSFYCQRKFHGQSIAVVVVVFAWQVDDREPCDGKYRFLQLCAGVVETD